MPLTVSFRYRSSIPTWNTRRFCLNLSQFIYSIPLPCIALMIFWLFSPIHWKSIKTVICCVYCSFQSWLQNMHALSNTLPRRRSWALVQFYVYCKFVFHDSPFYDVPSHSDRWHWKKPVKRHTARSIGKSSPILWDGTQLMETFFMHVFLLK